MSLPILLLIEGFSYIVLFGIVSLLKREGLSLRFAIEAGILTVIISAMTALTAFQTHPILFLVLLYLVTMRVRLLADLGTIFARQGNYDLADRLYHLAEKLWPDTTSHLIVQVNQGTSLLQRNKLDDAITTFTAILQQVEQGYLGVKYEAAARYNLGVAYLRKNLDAQAIMAFNSVVDTWPTSEYARRAEAVLEKHRHKERPSTSKDDA